MTLDFGWQNFIFAVLLIVAEAIHMYRTPRRSYFVLRAIGCMVLCLGIARVIPLFVGGKWQGILFNYVVRFLIFCASVGAYAICFKTDLFYLLNRCLFGYATYCCSYVWWVAIDAACGLWFVAPINAIVFAAVFIVSYAIFFIFSLRKNKLRQIKIDKRIKIMIIMLTVSLFYGLIATDVSGEERIYFIVPVMFALTYLGLFMLNTYTSEKHLQDDNEILQKILEDESKHYEMSQEYIDIINVKCHDLKHQIMRIREEKNAVESEVLDEIERAVDIYDADIKTRNKALDTVLYEKTRFCLEKGIKITCIADGSLLLFMKPADIYSLIGNVLDNAIEAVSGLESIGKRIIGLTINEEAGLIRIRAENYFIGERKIERGIPVTTKDDKNNHGFGTKSIRMIAEKYGGQAVFTVSGEIFTVNILIPFPSDKA